MKVLIFGTARRFIIIIVITSPGLVVVLIQIVNVITCIIPCVISILAEPNDRLNIETF